MESTGTPMVKIHKGLILVIDDDQKLNSLLESYLTKFGYEVITKPHPKEGLEELKNHPFDLVVLDVMLPEIDGFEVCQHIRKYSKIPIIMLTARGEVMDRVIGLELGADDYLPKPFEPRELIARIQAVIRRNVNKIENTTEKISRFGDLRIHYLQRKIQIGEKNIELTTMEFMILELFTKRAGEVLNRDQILEELRGLEWDAFNRSIDILVSRLRNKLKDDPKHPKYIKTIWGTGYMFIGRENE